MENLSKEFEVKIKYNPKYSLNMSIVKTNEYLKLEQSKYTEQTIDKYNMIDAKISNRLQQLLAL